MNNATPLIRAVESSNPRLVEYLVERKANVQVENFKGQNTLELAESWASPDAYMALRRRWDELPPVDEKQKNKKKGGKKSRAPSGRSSAKSRAGASRVRSPLSAHCSPPHNRRRALPLIILDCT